MGEQNESKTPAATPGKVRIKGEERDLPGFMAFKAFHAMDLIAEVQGAWRQVLESGATFKREYEAEHYVEMTRTEARRMFRPKPLYSEQPVTNAAGEQVLDADGDPVLSMQPVMVKDETTGELTPMLGPDPLEHMTEEDWAGSNQTLRESDSPKRNMVIAVMVPRGFELARTQVLRLMALALTTNKQLEEWDDAGTAINPELDKAGKKLLHEANPQEFIRLAVAVVNLCQEELADPFGELMEAVTQLQRKRAAAAGPSESAPAAGPMRIENDESPDSAAGSAPPTDGSSERSSTEPVSAASSPSESD